MSGFMACDKLLCVWRKDDLSTCTVSFLLRLRVDFVGLLRCRVMRLDRIELLLHSVRIELLRSRLQRVQFMWRILRVLASVRGIASVIEPTVRRRRHHGISALIVVVAIANIDGTEVI